MSIGKVIYYHRRKQNKTQEQLCQGICSVTHLSKIENNVKEANPKTLQLLCDRLQISLEDENKKSELVKHKLDMFYDAIERLHQDKATILYKELQEYKEYVHCTDMIYLYELYMLRYYLLLHDFSVFEESSRGIHKYISKFSPFEAYIWDLLQGIYYGKKEQFPQALLFLSRAENKAEEYQAKITEYYYFRSALHGHLSHYSLSIHYAYKALHVFQQTNNLLRMVHVKMILAVNFIHIGEFEKGKEMLVHILSDAEMLQDTETKALSLHNLGFLYYRQGNLEESLNYYSQALQHKEKNSASYYITISYLAEALISFSQNEKAAKLLSEVLDSFQDQKSPRYIELKILYLEAAGTKKSLIHYLIKHGLPIIEQHINIDRGIKYLQVIAAYYEEKQDYASANHYLHISNQHLKNLLTNIGSPVDLREAAVREKQL
ncbi:transcriptional regulator with XRE-family HTH domain [Neobacillus niacini]|jgi:transcriptional regulator with XRE-family HTH domain|uniref:helix-turn-helix transcriptional regulator n=1 Tax=Neobacillus driksii TaxID=3035913 RepID=UPI00277DE0CB|nr:helix-turn-helix transcriptional regulator [Neobacillus niacini]MDQ0975033.1 transcriptional regulator with XRE-family HTH domain [Neobacillus niacini]